MLRCGAGSVAYNLRLRKELLGGPSVSFIAEKNHTDRFVTHPFPKDRDFRVRPAEVDQWDVGEEKGTSLIILSSGGRGLVACGLAPVALPSIVTVSRRLEGGRAARILAGPQSSTRQRLVHAVELHRLPNAPADFRPFGAWMHLRYESDQGPRAGASPW